MEMTLKRIAAIVATAHNLYSGRAENLVMTAEMAETLEPCRQITLLTALAENGGSDLYTKQNAIDAIATVRKGQTLLSSAFNCSPEQLKKQYAANLLQLETMRSRAISSGKKVGGYTADQLTARIDKIAAILSNLKG